MASNIAHQQRNPIEQIPTNIMSFDFHPESGPSLTTWRIKSYQEVADYGEPEAAFSTVGKKSAKYLMIGGGIGYGAEFVMDRFPDFFGPLKKIKAYLVTSGVVIGATAGAIKGFIEFKSFKLDRPVVGYATQQAASRAKKIMEIFVSSHLENDQNMDSITCPISREMMVFPTQVDCGSNVPHIFDYFYILDWVGIKNPKRCPLCSKDIQIKNFKRHTKTEEKVHNAVESILKKMETILSHLPKRFGGLSALPNFSEVNNLEVLAEKVKQGQAFLHENMETIAEKIKNPDQLSLEETFALGYFLVHQFKPLKKKIDQIYMILIQRLAYLRTEGHIDASAYQKQQGEVEKWYSDFDVIPKECKIIRTLYQL